MQDTRKIKLMEAVYNSDTQNRLNVGEHEIILVRLIFIFVSDAAIILYMKYGKLYIVMAFKSIILKTLAPYICSDEQYETIHIT